MRPVLALHRSFLLFLTFSPQISILRPSKLSIPDKRTMSMNNKVSHSNRLITSLSCNFFICSRPETLSFCPQSFSVIIIINFICLKFRKTFQQWRLSQWEPNWTKIDFIVLVCLFINIILSLSFFFFFFFNPLQIVPRASLWQPSKSFTDTLVYASSLAGKSDPGFGS